MSIGEMVRKRRHILGITQQKLARNAGVTAQHISAIEQGKRQPSLSFLPKLAEELGVTVDYLVTGKESVITGAIPATKGDKKLSLSAKNALIALMQELYAVEL